MQIYLFLLILLLIFAAVILLAQVFLPAFLSKYRQVQEKKVEEASKKLDNMFMEVERKKLSFFLILTPIVLTLCVVFIFKSAVMGAVAGAVGIILPNILIKFWEKKRKDTFTNQLLDGMMLLSGCLKAGLSILQAFEVMVEDMSGPISQEFSWVLKEIKMGVSLEDSLKRLNRRMPSEDLVLITNAILVSSATGGNLVNVVSRICVTIRDTRKLKNNIKTLTLQGRLQGIIMGLLPFVFIWFVLTFNKEHFNIMLTTEIGRMLIAVAVFLLVVGLFLIAKFSKLPEV
ncbi:MAG TPA: type II secretion system F family protein [Candidatus Margulisiibacteriota bacterium]|nr:type II secretion system F family protein [Candidatus Margulisiibacteriota bacterium]